MTNSHAAPDAALMPGELWHLVVGNAGRLLDTHRTLVAITAIRPETGTFIVRIEGFEDGEE
jgi:hypothetical protein